MLPARAPLGPEIGRSLAPPMTSTVSLRDWRSSLVRQYKDWCPYRVSAGVLAGFPVQT